MNFRAVIWLLGCVHLLLGGFMLVPVVVAALYQEKEAVAGCLLAAFLTLALGGVLTFLFRGSTTTSLGRIDYFRREGLAVVGLSWIVAGVMGALPFLTTGEISSPVDALFESVSGFTTTGATILSGEAIEGLSHGVTFWRSFTHWLGGIGIVLVFVVLFPTGGRSLFRSEVPGVSREAVQQRVRDSAFGLLRVYSALTVLETGLLFLANGHDLFDALVHSFGTVATGGFSTHSSSIAYYASFNVELIVVVFMFLCGINFAVYDTLWRQGLRVAWRQAAGSAEIRAYAGLVVLSIVFIAGVLWFWGGSNGDPSSSLPDYSSLLRSLRDTALIVVSLVTSTGFGGADYDQWPDVCRFLLVLLSVCGACAGSTGGGIKVIRLMILGKAAMQGVKRFARPRAIHHVRVDGHTIDESTVGMISAYCGLWFFVFSLGTLALVGMNLQPPGLHGDQGLLVAASAVVATLNNIGPGLAAVGPSLNFGFMPDLAKLLLTFFMILGRLEFYAVVVLFVPRFWKS